MSGQQGSGAQGQHINMMGGGMQNGGMMMQGANMGMMGGGSGMTNLQVSNKLPSE